MTAHKRRHTTQPFALCKLSYSEHGRQDILERAQGLFERHARLRAVLEERPRQPREREAVQYVSEQALPLPEITRGKPYQPEPASVT